MNRFQNVDIHPGPVGLAFSGGADSAVLLYILLSNKIETIHLYTFLSAPKRHVFEPVATKVLEKCIELTGNRNVIQHKKYIDQQTPHLVHESLKSYILEDKLNVMYTGMTKFPPDSVIENFSTNFKKEDPYVYNNRRYDVTRPEYFDYKFYRPFINLDRRGVKKIYESLNLEEKLFPVTRSCENMESPLKHCGQCFWCQERHWGFGYLE